MGTPAAHSGVTMRNLIALATALLCLGVTAGARAAVSFATVEPAARPFHVGNLSVTALHDAKIIVANDGKTFGMGVSTVPSGRCLVRQARPPIGSRSASMRFSSAPAAG